MARTRITLNFTLKELQRSAYNHPSLPSNSGNPQLEEVVCVLDCIDKKLKIKHCLLLTLYNNGKCITSGGLYCGMAVRETFTGNIGLPPELLSRIAGVAGFFGTKKQDICKFKTISYALNTLTGKMYRFDIEYKNEEFSIKGEPVF